MKAVTGMIGRDVLVVGAGIGGLAAACCLAQRGAAVRVLEQAQEIRAFGAGLQISPNGMATLAGLGVADEIAALSPRASAVYLRDFRKGAAVARVPLSRQGRPYHYVHRADLVEILANRARDLGVEITLGAAVAGGEEGDVILANGQRETADVIVGADGLHSRIRAHLEPRGHPFFTGQIAWRAVIDAQDGDDLCDVQVFMGPARHIVIYPLRGGRLINIVAVEEQDQWVKESWSEAGDPAQLVARFGDFCREARAYLGRVTQCYQWGLFRHPVARKWQNGQMVLLGDAAHPTLPFLAQGANMALEDAWILSARLSDTPDLPEALAHYEAQRRPRTARIVQAASDNADHYHIRPSLFRVAAHTGLRVVSRYAPHLLTQRFEWIYGFDPTKS